MSTIATYPRRFASLVKIEHTVFALPFAYVGAFLAVDAVPSAHDLVWITVAMVGARSLAMALNRLVEHVQAENRGKNIHAFALQPGTVVTRLAEDTMASPDARKWLPAMTERLAALRGTEEGTRDLAICADVCVRMAAGDLDPLAGRYLDIAFDLDAMLAEAKAAEN